MNDYWESLVGYVVLIIIITGVLAITFATINQTKDTADALAENQKNRFEYSTSP